MKPFTDGKIVKECMQVAVEAICPDQMSVINKISLSNDTVTKRVENIACNLKEQLHSLASKFMAFSLALDESTDVSDSAQLAIFIKGVDVDFNVSEELLTIRSMKGTTTGEDIFKEVTEAMKDANLSFNCLVGIATDGAPAMVGTRRGLQGQVMAELARQNLSK